MEVPKKNQILSSFSNDEKLINQTKKEVTDLCGQFPVYSE